MEIAYPTPKGEDIRISRVSLVDLAFSSIECDSNHVSEGRWTRYTVLVYCEKMYVTPHASSLTSAWRIP